MSAGGMTGWFQPEVKPVRGGVYQVSLPDCPLVLYAFWTGDRWGASASNPDRAEALHIAFSCQAIQAKVWRGFTEPQL
jgi:hypothetical protein